MVCPQLIVRIKFTQQLAGKFTQQLAGLWQAVYISAYFIFVYFRLTGMHINETVIVLCLIAKLADTT